MTNNFFSFVVFLALAVYLGSQGNSIWAMIAGLMASAAYLGDISDYIEDDDRCNKVHRAGMVVGVFAVVTALIVVLFQ